ncbi:MAG: FapA family protein [bacterium]|nr:FapA family protein [bacterium]
MENQAILTRPENLTVKVTPDKMKAYLCINNHNSNNALLEMNTISYKLWDEGVKYGIKAPVIKTMLAQQIYDRSILIAEGIPPQDGQDAVIKYKFKKRENVDLKEDFDGKVDFRDLGLIDIVHAGDVLATKIPATHGTHGKMVIGEEIPPENGQDVNIPIGENTHLANNGMTLLSSVDGYVFWDNDKIGVKTTYEVPGDVDMNVGNIYFIGPVKVKGDVKEGFSIKTEGDIEIEGGVENATLISEGNITIMQGIRGIRCQVYAKGNIICKFIEHANIEARGNVIVTDAILHSQVIAGDGVYVLSGKKGIIIGGLVKAKNEINVKNIGNMSEVSTEIEVGIEPGIREEVNRLEEALETERKQLQETKLNYNTLMVKHKTQEAEEYLLNQKELEENIKMMNEHLIQLKKHTLANQGGKVSVVDTLWPGVKLTLGNSTLLTKIDYRYITFINKIGTIDQRKYEKPKIKIDELSIKKVTYWEREIDKIRDVK